MAKKTALKKENDGTSEERIKEAARKVFTQKGYAATRTRDIAAEAGINLALLNYYFRSKEKLFEIVMRETITQFFSGIMNVLNEEDTSLEEKLAVAIDQYIDLLIEQPDLPLFILSEIRANPQQLASVMGGKGIIQKSEFMRQVREAAAGAKKHKIHPMQLFINIMGLIVFPFVGQPILREVGGLKKEEFETLMRERKKLIPVWIKAIIKSF